jgi:hypothetical protein
MAPCLRAHRLQLSTTTRRDLLDDAADHDATDNTSDDATDDATDDTARAVGARHR